MRYLRSTSVPAPYISVTPDACPNVFEEPGSNMKSMPPRYCNKLLHVFPKVPCSNTGSYKHLAIFVCLLSLYDFFIWLCYFSLETSPITDSDTAKRTVFQRSYSVVASEYDKQHSASPARVKAVPRRRVHSGDAGNVVSLVQHSYKCLINSANYHNDIEWCLRMFASGVLLLYRTELVSVF